ncbi:MAG: outer membrane beta-barrel protein [Gemmatimonadales bacterium]|nr:outer membrane beta-barrel protein [Gemmatimonadales bacterium]
MGTLRRKVQTAAAAVLLVASPAAAQDTPRGLTVVSEGERAGFWAGFGIGAGGESFDLRNGAGYSSELYRPTVSLRLGGTVNRRLRLGGEVLSWIDERGDAVESLTSFLFIGQLYPLSTAGLYLKGGAGLGRNAVDFDFGQGIGDTGFAGLLGAGWELRVGRRFYLNPAVDLVEHRYGGRAGEGYRERLVNLSLGVLFQSGR